LKGGTIRAIGENDAEPGGSIKNHLSEDLQIYLKVVGLIDIKLEIERLRKRNNELQKLIDGLNKKTSIPNYMEKVPENVRQENTEKLQKYQLEKDANDTSIQDLTAFN